MLRVKQIFLLPLFIMAFSASSQGFKTSWINFYKDNYTAIPKPEIAKDFRSNISNKVFKPEGDGPFPAVVLVHTAGGLANDHIKIHAQNLVAKGYVVLIQDSMGPRGYRVVTPSTPKVHPPVIVKDAYQGLDFLLQQSFVDKNRIYEMGTSLGGFVATSLGSKGVAEVNEAKGRFRASVSFYSSCALADRDPYKYVLEDIDMPVLMLIAGDDKELKHGNCFSQLDALKSKGVPIDYYIYEGIGHGWDKQGEVRFGYIYSEEITKDSFNRAVSFFEKNN